MQEGAGFAKTPSSPPIEEKETMHFYAFLID